MLIGLGLFLALFGLGFALLLRRFLPLARVAPLVLRLACFVAFGCASLLFGLRLLLFGGLGLFFVLRGFSGFVVMIVLRVQPEQPFREAETESPC